MPVRIYSVLSWMSFKTFILHLYLQTHPSLYLIWALLALLLQYYLASVTLILFYSSPMHLASPLFYLILLSWSFIFFFQRRVFCPYSLNSHIQMKGNVHINLFNSYKVLFRAKNVVPWFRSANWFLTVHIAVRDIIKNDTFGVWLLPGITLKSNLKIQKPSCSYPKWSTHYKLASSFI